MLLSTEGFSMRAYSHRFASAVYLHCRFLGRKVQMPRFSFHMKLAAVVLVPFLAVMLLGTQGMVERYRIGEEISGVRQLVSVSVNVSGLVHELQRERGRSAGFLGSKGAQFGKELNVQRKATDAALERLRSVLGDSMAKRQESGKEYRKPLEAALGRLERLEAIRESVSNQTVTGAGAVAYYTDTNAALLDTVAAISGQTPDGKLSCAVSTYASFLRLKELTGLERAVLTNVFASDKFADGMYVQFTSLLGAQGVYEQAFLAAATPRQAAFYRQTVSGPEVDEVARLRQITLDGKDAADSDGFGIAADLWFNSITVKIDLQKRVEDELAANLQADADELIKRAKLARNLYAALTLVVIVVSGGLAGWLARSIVRPVAALIGTARQVSADGNYAVRAKKTTNDELGALVDCFNRMLMRIEANTAELQNRKATLEQEVLARTAELEAAQKSLILAARQAGMAEIANSVLHDIGNALNSVKVSAACVETKVRQNSGLQLTRVVTLLREHAHDLGTFLTVDARGRQLPKFLENLADAIAHDQKAMLDELKDVTIGVDHINEIMHMQQDYAGSTCVLESVKPKELIDDAMRLNELELSQHGIRVIRDLTDVPALPLDRHMMLQILLNLIAHAIQAFDGVEGREKLIRLVLESTGSGSIRVSVADNGAGMVPEILQQIFSQGVTTKRRGHGFGLHGSALAAKAMGGSLTARSGGPGQGSEFVLDISSQGEEMRALATTGRFARNSL